MAGDKGYCSPSCGKTVKGAKCTDECQTRGYQYYWCHVGDNWDYCSRSSCQIKAPPSYKDCSASLVNKMAWFEYLYYPGYWLAKGYENKMAAVWKPENGIKGKELFCPDEGYGWMVHGANDGSVYLESTRPGYENYYLIGYGKSEEKSSEIDEDGDLVYEEETSVYNMGNAVNIAPSKQYHETFAFRIICKDCSTMEQCRLWRLHDEFKLYSDSLGYLNMCKECGSQDWFNWRVHVPNNVNLTCSRASKTFSCSIFMQTILIVLFFFVFYSMT